VGVGRRVNISFLSFKTEMVELLGKAVNSDQQGFDKYLYQGYKT
jgi:hypothetical protein